MIFKSSCLCMPAFQGGDLSSNGIRRDRRESFGLAPEDLRTLRALKTPAQIQKFIDALPYQYANTAWSPQRALRERKGHCLEGALLAAAALRVNGHPPLLMDLEAVHDDDHVLAIYREARPVGRHCQVELRGTALSRAHLPHAARTGAQLL